MDTNNNMLRLQCVQKTHNFLFPHLSAFLVEVSRNGPTFSTRLSRSRCEPVFNGLLHLWNIFGPIIRSKTAETGTRFVVVNQRLFVPSIVSQSHCDHGVRLVVDAALPVHGRIAPMLVADVGNGGRQYKAVCGHDIGPVGFVMTDATHATSSNFGGAHRVGHVQANGRGCAIFGGPLVVHEINLLSRAGKTVHEKMLLMMMLSLAFVLGCHVLLFQKLKQRRGNRGAVDQLPRVGGYGRLSQYLAGGK